MRDALTKKAERKLGPGLLKGERFQTVDQPAACEMQPWADPPQIGWKTLPNGLNSSRKQLVEERQSTGRSPTKGGSYKEDDLSPPDSFI